MKKIGILTTLIMLAFTAPTWAYTLLSETFNECTLGGSITPGVNTVGTTGMAPTVGTVTPFAGDYGAIVAGLNGSPMCLQAQDHVANNGLRLLFNPSSNPTAGNVTASFTFLASGTMTGGPLCFRLEDGTARSGTIFLQLLLYSDLHFLATNSTTSLTTGGYATGSLVQNKQYQVTLTLNLTTYLYAFSIYDITDSTSTLSVSNLSFVNDTSIATTGLGGVDIDFGFWDFGGSPAYIDFGNLSLTAGGAVFGAADETFLGPFASWVNVKTAYGAYGDGVHDDTTAIQNALNSLQTLVGNNNLPANTVLYFPAGTYKISSGLTLTSARNVEVVGQDPLTTTIKWAGAGNSTVPMLWLDGVADSRFGRITFDGSGSTVTGMAHYYNTANGRYNSTGIYHSDERFQNMAIGIAMGKEGTGYNNADGDINIVRDHFFRCSQAGVRTGSYNSFQNYIWDSEFVDCYDGADNAGDEGSFYIYRSYFENSSHADIWLYEPLRSFDFRGNTSVGSAQFVLETSNSQTIDGLQFQDNKILDPKNGVAISSTETGDIVLTDNQIRMLVGAIGPADVVMNTSTYPVGPDLDSIGNTYTLFTPGFVVNGTGARSYTQNDSVVSIGSINSSVPTMPGTPALPANFSTNEMDVPLTYTAAQINAIFASPSGWAWVRKGQQPVVHFRNGTYSINTTIIVPSGLDVQLMGDSTSSILNWTGTGSGPILQLTGPSSALVSDILFDGESLATAITITSPDQVGSKIYIEGGDWQNAFTQNGILVNSCENAIIEAHAFECGSDPSAGSTARLLNVIGSGSSSATGYTAIFGGDGGTFSNSGTVFQATNDANLDVVDHFYQSNTPRLIQLSGTNNVTFAGEVGTPVSGTSNAPWVELDNIQGTATFIDCCAEGSQTNTPNPYIYVNGETSATQALFMGFNALEWSTGITSYFSQSGSGGTVSLVNSKYGISSGACYQTANAGSTLTSSFVTTMLSQSRAIQPMYPPTITSGVTSVQLINLGMASSTTDLQVGP